MDRRAFLLGAAGLAASSFSLRAMPWVRHAAVSRPKVVKQECPNWCWAAVASMIFDNLGHQIAQQTIVEKICHGLYCATVQPLTISAMLNTPWVDDNNRTFFPKVEAAYDQYTGVDNITDALVINELVHNRLLLYANPHHCMAIAEADYIDTPAGPKILRAYALDPWPSNPDYHPLGVDGLRPMTMGGEMAYLAAVRA